MTYVHISQISTIDMLCFLFFKNKRVRKKEVTTTNYNVKALDITSNSGKLTYLASSSFQQMEALPALPRYLLPLASGHAAKEHRRNAEEEESTPTGLLGHQCISGTSLSDEPSN